MHGNYTGDSRWQRPIGKQFYFTCFTMGFPLDGKKLQASKYNSARILIANFECGHAYSKDLCISFAEYSARKSLGFSLY